MAQFEIIKKDVNGKTKAFYVECDANTSDELMKQYIVDEAIELKAEKTRRIQRSRLQPSTLDIANETPQKSHAYNESSGRFQPAHTGSWKHSQGGREREERHRHFHSRAAILLSHRNCVGKIKCTS